VAKGISVTWTDIAFGHRSTCQDDGSKLYEFFAPEVVSNGN